MKILFKIWNTKSPLRTKISAEASGEAENEKTKRENRKTQDSEVVARNMCKPVTCHSMYLNQWMLPLFVCVCYYLWQTTFVTVLIRQHFMWMHTQFVMRLCLTAIETSWRSVNVWNGKDEMRTTVKIAPNGTIFISLNLILCRCHLLCKLSDICA